MDQLQVRQCREPVLLLATVMRNREAPLCILRPFDETKLVNNKIIIHLEICPTDSKLSEQDGVVFNISEQQAAALMSPIRARVRVELKLKQSNLSDHYDVQKIQVTIFYGVFANCYVRTMAKKISSRVIDIIEVQQANAVALREHHLRCNPSGAVLPAPPPETASSTSPQDTSVETLLWSTRDSFGGIEGIQSGVLERSLDGVIINLLRGVKPAVRSYMYPTN